MGCAVGFLSGLFGVGGGFLLTPLLIFMGVPTAVAVGTGSMQILASSVSRRHRPIPAAQRRHQDGRWCWSPAAWSARSSAWGWCASCARSASSICSSSLSYVTVPRRRRRADDDRERRHHAPRASGQPRYGAQDGPAQLGARPALQDAVPAFEALHQRHAAGRHRRLRRLLGSHHGRRRRLRHGAGHDLSVARADQRRHRHLAVPDRVRHGGDHRCCRPCRTRPSTWCWRCC